MAQDNWRTPSEIYNYFEKFLDFKFNADVCASKNNAKCDLFFTEDNSCLDANWADYLEPNSFVWCNPPYSNPRPFVEKCIHESKTNGIGSVMLLNHDMSVDWSRLLVAINATLLVFIASGDKKLKTYNNGRIAFWDENCYPINGNNKGQFVIIINPFVNELYPPQTRYLKLSDVIAQGGQYE